MMKLVNSNMITEVKLCDEHDDDTDIVMSITDPDDGQAMELTILSPREALTIAAWLTDLATPKKA